MGSYVQLLEISRELGDDGATNVNKKDARAGFLGLLSQFLIFGWKNLLLALRNWKGTLLQLVSPLFVVLILFGFQQAANTILDASNIYPTPTPVGIYPQCRSRNHVPCITVMYSPANVPWVKSLMQDFAIKNELDYDSTFEEVFNVKGSFEIDNRTIFNHILNNPNSTQHAVMFLSGYSYPTFTELPPDVGYVLFYNSTAAYDYSLEFMRSLDELLLQHRTKNPNASIDVEVNTFPVVPARYSGFDIIAAFGGAWFYVPAVMTFFMLLTEITMEKEQKLRSGMQMMGLRDCVYWSIWWLTGTVFTVLSSLVLIGAGRIFKFDFFTNANFAAVFLLFLCFGLASNAMAFFWSTIVKTSRSAQTLAYSIILVGFVFLMILSSAYGIIVNTLFAANVGTWVKVLRWIFTILYPPFNLAVGFNNIVVYSGKVLNTDNMINEKGPGYNWSKLSEERHLDYFNLDMTVPSNVDVYTMLLLNTAIYMSLALYLDNIVASNHGTARPFYYFLTRRYWGFKVARNEEDTDYKAMSKNHTDKDLHEEERKTIQSLEVKSETGLQLLNLTKVYTPLCFNKTKDSVKAVDNLTLSVDKGTTLCILGHNGAGKTTTIHMLLGLFPPTNGVGMINGKDVVDDTAQIRGFTGVCPQHDILWDELTAREHLRIFARLKGVHPSSVKSEVEDKLAMVGLTEVGSNKVRSYSGGMKRRLSVAIASIADPKIIFMDEPTTGMDPVNQKSVWDLIQKLKKDRIVILTTHNMEEADILGDKIAIMAKGRLCAIGNSLHLKSRFGTGYRIGITLSDMQHKSTLLKKVKGIIPEAVIQASNAGSITMGIPLSCRDKMETFVQFLEDQSRFNGTELHSIVEDWNIAHTTLEDVFLKVTKQEGYEYRTDIPEQKDELRFSTGSDTLASSTEGILPATSREKHKLTSFRALLRKNLLLQRRQKGTNCCQMVTPVLVMIVLALLQHVVTTQLKAHMETEVVVSPLIELNPTIYSGYYQLYDCMEYFYFSAPEDMEDIIGSLPKNGSMPKYGILSKIGRQHQCYWDNNAVNVPFYEKRSSYQDIQLDIYKELLHENSVPYDYLPHRHFPVPDGAVDFKYVDNDGHISYTIEINDHPLRNYHRVNRFIEAMASVDRWYTALLFKPKRLALMSMINDAFTEYTGNLMFDKWSEKLVTMMPYEETPIAIIGLVEVFGSFLYPIMLSIQLPVYLYLLVLEKTDKLRELMQMHGLRKWAYYLSHVIFCFILYLSVIAFVFAFGLATRIRFFHQTNFFVLATFFVLWGNVLISLSMLLSTFISAKRAAVVFGYIISLAGSLIAIMITVGIYSNVTIPVPVTYFIWPQFAFVRAFYLLNNACAVEYQCYGSFSSISPHDELITCFVALLLDSIIFYGLFLYLDNVMPREFGVRKHPLFCLGSLSSFLRKNKFERDYDFSAIDINEGFISRKKLSHRAPLVAEGLSKKYPGAAKYSLHDLDLSVDAGECFALLGENGAGKSTTISLLTGLYPPSEGSAWIAGYDITSEMDKARLEIGVCPQFNILWDTLTVEEHLLFYARLKGISPKDEKTHVQEWLSKLGLEFAADRKVSNLSGGMKRRVSVGIALVGNPAVVFLDEPTTGLDPESRRQLWTILEQARDGRALILTTHSMEEAEVLSTRIGIMALGTMRCVGTPQKLKNSIGNLLCLKVSFAPENELVVEGFVNSRFRETQKVRAYEGAAEFHIPQNTVVVSEVFGIMEAESKDNGVLDWSFSQVGLEEVFRKVVEDSHNST